MGWPHESLRTLYLQPWFEMDITHHFRRTDFWPVPRVDVVSLPIKTPGATASRRLECKKIIYLIDKKRQHCDIIAETRSSVGLEPRKLLRNCRNSRKTAVILLFFARPTVAGLAKTAADAESGYHTPIPAVVCCFADPESKNINRLILIALCLARARRPLRPRKGPLCFRRPKRHRRRIFCRERDPHLFCGRHCACAGRNRGTA